MSKAGLALVISLISLTISTYEWYNKFLLEQHELSAYVANMTVQNNILHSSVLLSNSGTVSEVIMGAHVVFFKGGPESEYFPKSSLTHYFDEPIVIEPKLKQPLLLSKPIDHSVFYSADKKFKHGETIYAGLNFIVMNDQGFDFESCQPFGQLKVRNDGVKVGSEIVLESVRSNDLLLRSSLASNPLFIKILNELLKSVIKYHVGIYILLFLFVCVVFLRMLMEFLKVY